jgi:hypothetical protein
VALPGEKSAFRSVYRLLTKRDVKQELQDSTLHILWPDDGVWYAAEIEEVSSSSIVQYTLLDVQRAPPGWHK